MKWFISKNKTTSFHIIPRIRKGGDYITVWWGRREIVIQTGNDETSSDTEINFTPVPAYPDNGVLICISEFIDCARRGFITDDDGEGYWSDVRFMSDIPVRFSSLKLQASYFLQRKRENKWYPTHVVWFNK